MPMPRKKVTLSLDTARLKELRDLAGSRSISAAVDDAVVAHLLRLRHLAAVDGPIQREALEWAAHVVERWDSSKVTDSKDRALIDQHAAELNTEASDVLTYQARVPSRRSRRRTRQ
jgi:hypothetical protein